MKELSSRAGMTRRERMTEVGRGLRAMVRWSERAGAQVARQLNLHPTDLTCLGYLASSDEPVSPKQIIAYMGLSSGSGTALIDRLEASGYIRRVPNPADRRSVLIELDRSNAAPQLAAYQTLQQSYSGVMDEFSDAELESIARFFDAISSVAPLILGDDHEE